MKKVLSLLILSGLSFLSILCAQEKADALLRSWQKEGLLDNPTATPDAAGNEALLDSIRLQLDSLALASDQDPLSKSLSYAQLDLRMPLTLDGRIYERISRLPLQPETSHYRRMVRFGEMRSEAIRLYANAHMTEVQRMRRNDQSSLLTDRRTLESRGIDAHETVDISEGLQLDNSSLNIEQVEFHADKWHRKGTSSFQMAQTALTENWYKGGENNMTIATDDKLVFSRYDENKITTFDVTLELKLSGYYTKSDTINPMRVSDNQFRMDVSYGYKAWKKWYYSAAFYAKTPVFDYHTANSRVTKSTFLSPLETNLSLGLEYKHSSKRLSWSLQLAPLSYNLKYVNDHRVNETSYGIKKNHRSLNQFGASVTNKLDWKISDAVTWTSRAYYFTAYESVLVEFENTINIMVGRYCSAKFYYYPRFDDSRDSEIQTKEMLTFGLAFVW